ncbi:MAG: PDZ domain-containing protein [Acidimicrobiales bacterium]
MRIAAALFAVGLAAGAAGAEAAPPRPAYENSVVGLTVSTQGWDPDRPWVKRVPQVKLALGVVVENHRILTTAQMVTDATLIEVEKLGQAVRAKAKVVRVDPEVDLAILSVDTPDFFDDLEPSRLAGSVPTEGSVLSIRWRSRQLEVSTSRVSRIEVQPSALGMLEYPFLYVTTDLKGGGWSEPVFADGRLVGLTVSQDDQVARVLPVDVIDSFLEMASEGDGYPGFAGLGFLWQVNEDPALTSYLGLPGSPRGVLVTKVFWGGSGCGVLKDRDILLALDGHPIDGSGYYRHPRYGLLRFTYIVADGHRAGETIPADVWRDGRQQRVQVTLRPARSDADLMPDRRLDPAPPYVVAGGLVFRELDGNYLRSWGDEWRKQAPIRLQMWLWLYSEEQSPERRRVVILSSVLPDAYNVGYHDIGDTVVREINGRPISSITQVVEAFKNPEGGFHRIVLEPNGQRSEIILDAPTFEPATKSILDAYHVSERLRLDEPFPDFGPSCDGGAP